MKKKKKTKNKEFWQGKTPEPRKVHQLAENKKCLLSGMEMTSLIHLNLGGRRKSVDLSR